MPDLKTAIQNSRMRELRRKREDILRDFGIGEEVNSMLRDMQAFHELRLKFAELSAAAQATLDFLEKRADSTIGFLENKIDALVGESRDKISSAVLEIRKVKKGDDGKTPTNMELIALIKPLIPSPIKGDNGRNPIYIGVNPPDNPQKGDLWYQD